MESKWQLSVDRGVRFWKLIYYGLLYYYLANRWFAVEKKCGSLILASVNRPLTCQETNYMSGGAPDSASSKPLDEPQQLKLSSFILWRAPKVKPREYKLICSSPLIKPILFVIRKHFAFVPSSHYSLHLIWPMIYVHSCKAHRNLFFYLFKNDYCWRKKSFFFIS
jgi:hypothetical protein